MLTKLVPGGILVTGKQELLPIQPAELQACQLQMAVIGSLASGDSSRFELVDNGRLS